MTCPDVRPLLDAHLDRELDLRTELEVADHLSRCAACARALEGRQSLRSLIRDANLYRHPSAASTSRVRAALAAEARPTRRASPFRWPLAWAAGAAAAALALIALLVPRPTGPSVGDGTAREVVASHVRSLLASHLTDVASTDQHTVKPWFDGKLDYAPPVVDLAASGFPLVGARLDYIAERPVAALVYRRKSHVINLFVWPSAGDEEPRPESRQGYNVIRWTGKGMTCRAVSDVNQRELSEFVKGLRQAAP